MMQLNEQLMRPVIVITGHYGSGKTSFALSLAERLAGMAKKPSLVDLDIVNPYFRLTDYREQLKTLGIQVEGPVYAGMNPDIPALPAHIDGMIETADEDHPVILDVGGDDAGAAALGRYHPLLERRAETGSLSMVCTVSFLRPLTAEPGLAAEMVDAIQAASRLRCTGLVNTTNLAGLTDAQMVLKSVAQAAEAADRLRLPVAATVMTPAVRRKMTQTQQQQLSFGFTLTRRVLLPWENGRL